MSVHPILFKEDLSADIDLSGEWRRDSTGLPAQDSEKNRITLERVGDTAEYDVVLGDGDKAWNALRVGKIGEVQIVELKGGPRDGFSPFKTGLPLYGFARIEIKNDELCIYFLNDPKMHGVLTEQKVPFLLHESGPGEEWLIITATTQELQSLVKLCPDKIFMSAPAVFTRTGQK